MKYLIGLGNYSEYDDSIGLRIVEYIADNNLDQGFSVIDLGSSSLNLFSYFCDETERILIVDCTKMGKQAGDFHFFSIDSNIQNNKRLDHISTHEDDVLSVIKLAIKMDYYIPPITFLGIEPMEIKSEFGISPVLQQRFAEYVKIAIQGIN